MLKASGAWLTAAFIAATLQAHAADPYDYVPLERAWFQAQTKINSGRFEVETRQTVDVSRLVADPFDAAAPAPNLRELERTRTFVFKGSRLKVTDSGPVYDIRAKQFEIKTESYFNDPQDARARWQLAAAHEFTFPIRLLRKYDPLWFVFKSSNCSLRAEEVQHQGLKCVKFIEKKWSRTSDNLLPIEVHYTVCPEQDYSIVKWSAIHSESNQVNFEMNVEHQQHADLGVWVPKKWTIESTGSTKPSESSTVTSFELNVDIAEEEFLQ